MNRLKDLRKEKRYTTRQLAEMININHSTITNLETGKTNLSDDYIKTFTDFFDVTADYLLGLTDIRKNLNKSAKKIPIYSQIDIDHGGNIIVRVENIRGYVGISDDTDNPVSHSMKAKDDSMKSTGIMSGDILLINEKGLIENNSIVAVAKGGGAAVVRKHVILENKKLLVSDLGIEPMDDKHFIVGKVVGFLREF